MSELGSYLVPENAEAGRKRIQKVVYSRKWDNEWIEEQLWQQGDRRNELGFATAPAPGSFPAVYQPFPGALIILNQGSGEVVVLPTANQR